MPLCPANGTLGLDPDDSRESAAGWLHWRSPPAVRPVSAAADNSLFGSYVAEHLLEEIFPRH